MKPLSQLIWITSIISFFILTGCTSVPKPPIARISLNVQSNINAYSSDKTESGARPVVIRLYELTSPGPFNSLVDFSSVFYDYKTALEGKLLNSEEFILIPGERKKINWPMHLNTRFVAVVAAFKHLDHSVWYATTPIPENESTPEIYILLKGNNVLIGAKKECGFFCKLTTPKPPVGSLYEVID